MIPGITASARRRQSGGGGDLPSEIGQPFGGGFYAGDIQYPDGQWYKLIVADVSAEADEVEWRTSWTGTFGTDHMFDGVANTNVMVAAGIELHPAAAHCISYQGGGFEDWYMPAIEELTVICENLGFDRPNCPPDFQTGGPQAFSNNFYWSSTGYGTSGQSWGWRFDYEDSAPTTRITVNPAPVRPVRRVPFNP